MASLSKADSKRMYSWWWNSHISPKNSKWLQENLADVDIKVKAMIRLIEEDADSFARRAEMYYKKRPELMKLVEELYRAYRALAERYDHATGALRQAHKTMSEAFPNQVPAGCDDSVSNSPYESDPQTPDTKSITSFDPVDLQKDGSNGSYGSMGTARKALSFSDSGDGNDKHRPHDQNVSQLKEALAKIEDEKEAGMKQYLESLDKLSKLESEMLKYQENSRELAERATNAEAETHEMKQMLQKLEVDKEESLERYREVQKKLDEINEQNLKEEIERLKEERDAAYDQYKQLIDLQTDLENKLLEAEKEIERLKVEIVKLTKEKDAQTVLYQQCMETISSLELRLVCAEEETEQLKTEIENGISLLKGAEEQRVMLEKSNKSLHLELESMGVKIGVQSQEITEKQKELGRLWTCIQEERLRFVEAETAFQTLQQLHAQSQEELRSMAGELQNRAQVLRDIETHNRVLEEEIRMKIEENKNLNELSLSSAISLKEMQTEINFLKESNGKLEEEVDLRVDQRNALQQEIYCLKEELNGLNEKHKSVLEQVAYVGLNPESLGLSVKELRDQKSNLESEWEKEKAAKATLLVKLEVMNQLLERNVVLENSLSDLGAELEGVRGKLKLLEEAYQSLLDEKSNLVVEKANLLGQLQVTTDNLSHVSENNTVLENSLFDAHVKLEVLKQKSKSFEDSCQLLADEKSVLITEKGTLVSQMEVTEKQLNEMKMKYTDLEEKYSLLRSQIQLMQTESQNKIKEFEHELDKSFDSEIKILILMKCVQDFQEAYKLSESLIHVLKQEKTETAIKIKSLTDENNGLKNGMHQLLKAAGLSLHPACENGLEQTWVDNIRENIEGINRALSENEDRNTEMVVEITILLTLLTQFKTKLADLEAEKLVTEHELRARDEKLHGLQNEAREISETNEELRSKVTEAGVTESGLRTQLENLQCELSVLQEASRTLEMENSAVIEDKKSLLKDNIHIKNQIRVLEESIDNIFGKVLSQDIFSQTLKNHIHEKHGELSLVEKKLEDVTEENLDLKKSIADLQRENNEATVTKHQQGKQILQLLEENDNLSQENQILNINLQESRENQEKTEEKSRVLETEGSLIYGDLQASVVYQVLLEEKISELTEVCLNLQDENDSKDLNTGLLEERSNVLECENADLKARLDAYGPALESLKNSIVSLENQTCVRTKVQQPENENQKDGEPVTLEQDPYLELQGLQSKVKAIETAVAEMQMLSMQQKLDSDAKLESAMIQIEELIQQNVSRKTNGKLKSTPEISESDPKDIMLDQASECSSYGVSKRGLTEGEIWETADDSKFISSHHPTASDVSLDNFMDKLELSRRFKEPREDGTKRKVLERLNSDVLKLTNLQITIEDLKRKVEITSKSRRGKAMIECETLKGQLMEAESSIQKLYELNARLVKHIKGNTEKEKSSTTSGSGESESMRRRKVGEQARRVSEKIGRLQLEIQKIQFVLVKLDDETEPGGKRRFLDTKKRVLLKDYLYGGGKPKATISSSGRRKKNHFCACVEPSTKGD